MAVSIDPFEAEQDLVCAGLQPFPDRVGIPGVGFVAPPRCPMLLPDDQDSRLMLQELDVKISTMERLLGNLHASAAGNGGKFTTLKVDLRVRLTTCYLAKRALQRGEFRHLADLDEVLKRLRVKVEHGRFRVLGPIRGEHVAAVDLDHLSRRLGRVSE